LVLLADRGVIFLKDFFIDGFGIEANASVIFFWCMCGNKCCPMRLIFMPFFLAG
jgi:hypothetical protein